MATVIKGYDNGFTYIDEEGAIKNGKRTGPWKGNFKGIHTSFTETYQDGALVNGTATFQDGGTATYTNSRQVAPQFAGGVAAFSKYLGENITYPRDARRKEIEGTVILSFIVGKDGDIDNVVVTRSVSESIDAEAVRVIKKSPRWVPGMYFGRPTQVWYSVPVNFSLRKN